MGLSDTTVAQQFAPPADGEDVDLVDLLEQSKDSIIFVTGRAGAGKTQQIKRFIKSTKKSVLVTAPTGVAALNCGGSTLHKQFCLPITLMDDETIKTVAQRQRATTKMAEVLIIDELSMVRADLIDSLDRILRIARRNQYRPFGGLQVICSGDPWQLPPIAKSDDWDLVKSRYPTPYFFESRVFKEFPPRILDMIKIFRQSAGEVRFLEILNAVRDGNCSQQILDHLNERYRPDFGLTPGYVTLCATNREVESINKKQLDSLPDSPKVFSATIVGEFNMKNAPVEEPLVLKVGAQVMFVRNDQDGRYVNGTVGTVAGFGTESIRVELESGKTVTLGREVWEENRYEVSHENGKQRIVPVVVGSFVQYPLRLAWSSSIHKIQGASLDRCIVDPKSIFECGQLYVALSRCRTFGGLILKNRVTANVVQTAPSVIKWFDEVKKSSQYFAVHQKFIAPNVAKQELEATKGEVKSEGILADLSEGRFLTSQQIAEARESADDLRDQIMRAGFVGFLDEIERLRMENADLKRRLKQKGKKTEEKESPAPKKDKDVPKKDKDVPKKDKGVAVKSGSFWAKDLDDTPF